MLNKNAGARKRTKGLNIERCPICNDSVYAKNLARHLKGKTHKKLQDLVDSFEKNANEIQKFREQFTKVGEKKKRGRKKKII